VVGAGLLVEAERLYELGWRVDALETTGSIARRSALYDEFANKPGCSVIDERGLKAKYRLTLITHVLDFVESPQARLNLLRSVTGRLTVAGRVLVSLRGWSDVGAAKRPTPRGDGIVTGIGTWTRGFTVDEAKSLLRAAGLSVEITPHPTSVTPGQVRLVCRRQETTVKPRSRRSKTQAAKSRKRSAS
jgi:hypothetical protein